MLIKLLRWFTGYLLVEINGYSPERFINLCSNREILIWELRKTGDSYKFLISLKAFRQLKPIVKKTKTRPHILKRYGLPFLLYKYRKKKIFFFGILLCTTILYVLSLYIWDIEVSGEFTNTKETIIKFLKSEEVYTGILRENINCKKIEESIRKEYEDIGWVSAELRGTRLLIKLKETQMPETREVFTEPCHLVASKDGIVMSIITRRGVPKVKEGDVVKKGDILVSGIIEIIGDSGEIIDVNLVSSDADIEMKTIHKYNKTYPLTYVKKVYTGEEKKAYSITLINKKINLYKPLKNYLRYDIIENDKNLRITNNFYLPVLISTITYREYNEKELKYTKEEIAEYANRKIERYINEIKENGGEVLENNISIQADSLKSTVKGNLIIKERCLRTKQISDSEWRTKEDNEYSGDNN